VRECEDEDSHPPSELPLGELENQIYFKNNNKVDLKSLIPDHEKSGIDLTSVRAGGVRHTIGKLSTRAKTLL
jgi:hypothetical protein